MIAPKLTVREVVALLLRAHGHVIQGSRLADDIEAVVDRYDAEVEAEEREEHRRALEDAESEAREPW